MPRIIRLVGLTTGRVPGISIVEKWRPDNCGTGTPGTDTGTLVTRREDSTVPLTWSEVVRRGTPTTQK